MCIRDREKGDTFETPEVIMSYSAEGFGKLSRIYHDADVYKRQPLLCSDVRRQQKMQEK